MPKRKQESKDKPERAREPAKAKPGERDLEPGRGAAGKVKGGRFRSFSDRRLKRSIREL
jgi:hypothetical protein